MQTFLDQIRQRLHWIVFLLLEIVSLVLLFRYNTYQGSIWFTQANAATGQVLEWQAGVLRYLDLGRENQLLVQQNLVLQHNIDVLRHELLKATHDSTRTELALRDALQGVELIPALVTDNSIRQRDNIITINRGRLDGVQPEMGVVSGTGVVGIVAQVGRHYATVVPVLNSRSNISVRLHDTEYFGYLQWRGGSPLHATVTDIPRHARLREGMQVETSGFSSVFPAGIFVGKVKRVCNSADGLAFELDVNLSTDFGCLREVNVVKMKEQD